MRRRLSPFLRVMIAVAVLMLILSCTGGAWLIHRSQRRPYFWLRGSEPSAHIPGEHGEARFFYGYYLAAGRLGGARVRLVHPTEFDWSWSPSPSQPTQALLLNAAQDSRDTPGNWSILLWPWVLGSGLFAMVLLTRLIVDCVLARWRHLSGCCPVCGYDMRASPERCPECGMAVAGRSPATA
jgi:hypothetical protein